MSQPPQPYPPLCRHTYALTGRSPCAHRSRKGTLYGFADDPDTTAAADFDPPSGGLFLIARISGKPIGCGGIRLLDEHAAEIKRMYVAEQARGHGIGRYILDCLERHAAARGATRILLETGKYNTAALALYHRAGYEQCPSYMPGRDHQVNRAMTKSLDNRPA